LFDILDPTVPEVFEGFTHKRSRGCGSRGQLGIDVLFARPGKHGDTLLSAVSHERIKTLFPGTSSSE